MPNTRQDRARIAASEAYEVYFVKAMYDVPSKVTRTVIKELKTTSRRKIYKRLRELGYTIDTKNI